MSKNDSQEQRFDLRLSLEDFGPLSSGSFSFKPLTVFVGQNNSGKSYTAMLVHSVFGSYWPARRLHEYPFALAQRYFIRGRGWGHGGPWPGVQELQQFFGSAPPQR